MGASGHTSENHLLGALPSAEAQRWLPLLESVDLPLGHVLYESGGTLAHVYFPTTAIVSLLYVMENGASAEIAVVGNEGVIGVSLFMGGESTPSRAVVQSAGHGFRLKSERYEGRIQSRGSGTASALALYPGADYANGSNCRVQSAPHPRSTAMPLAPLELGPAAGQPTGDDSGADCQHAGGAPRRGDRRGA
jgi:hypothetical protein